MMTPEEIRIEALKVAVQTAQAIAADSDRTVQSSYVEYVLTTAWQYEKFILGKIVGDE